MSTPIDPNAPVQWVNETAGHFALRMQQYRIPATGPAQAMAAGWVKLIVAPPRAPSGFDIK